MILESISAGCFSGRYLLKLNGRSFGRYSRRREKWFDSVIDIRLIGRGRFHLETTGWLWKSRTLIDVSSATTLAKADGQRQLWIGDRARTANRSLARFSYRRGWPRIG